VRVLDQEELARLLEVEASGLRRRLEELGWRFHEDSMGRLWAMEQNPPPADKR